MNAGRSRAAGLLAAALAALAIAGCGTSPQRFDASTRVPEARRDALDLQLVITVRDREAALQAAPGSTPHGTAVGGGSSYEPSPYAQLTTLDLAREYGLEWVAGWRIRLLGVHCVVLQARDAAQRDAALERLRRDSRVESVQPMNEFHGAADPAPPTGYSDPYFRLQRNLDDVGIPAAQRLASGRGIRVAVIDTGADLSHPDLRGRVLLARDFVGADPAGFSRDRHGTAVAGIIAAVANNGVGIVGVAPAAEILALKACWEERDRPGARCSTLTLAEAIAFAVEQRAAVINLSLAGPRDALLERLIARALAAGVVIVAADAETGNPAGSFPASVTGVIAVSNADLEARPQARATVAAPGRDVLTLAPRGTYDFVSGSSMASAIVSGVAALVLERRSRLAPDNVGELLRTTARRGTAELAGLVNACDAVARAAGRSPCSERPASVPGTSRDPELRHVAQQ